MIFEICEMIFEICEIIAMRATWDVSGGKSPKRFQPAPVPPCTSTSNDFTIRRNLLPAWQYRNRVFMKWVPSGVIQMGKILTHQHEMIPFLAGGSFFGNIFVSLNQIW